MWFRVGLKGTDLNRYVELRSEDRRKLTKIWLELAYLELHEDYVRELMSSADRYERYPELCEIEMVQKPPRKYAEFVIGECNREIDKWVSRKKLFESSLT